MLLRRVAEHVRTQNWFAVAIDFVVVVVGVFLGFQITQWNQQRVEREAELNYLNRLIADFESDRSQLDTIIARTQERFEYGRQIIRVFDSGSYSTSPKEFLEAVEMSSYFSYPSYATGTYDELMSTGNLRIIRSNEVKDAIARYHQSIDWNEQFSGINRAAQEALVAIEPDFLSLEQRIALLNEQASRSCSSDLVCGGRIPWGEPVLEASRADADSVLERLLARPEDRRLFARMARIQSLHYSNMWEFRELALNLGKSLDDYRQELTR